MPDQVKPVLNQRTMLRLFAEGRLENKPELDLSLSIGFAFGQVVGAAVGLIDSAPIFGNVIYGIRKGVNRSLLERDFRIMIANEEKKAATEEAEQIARNSQASTQDTRSFMGRASTLKPATA